MGKWQVWFLSAPTLATMNTHQPQPQQEPAANVIRIAHFKTTKEEKKLRKSWTWKDDSTIWACPVRTPQSSLAGGFRSYNGPCCCNLAGPLRSCASPSRLNSSSSAASAWCQALVLVMKHQLRSLRIAMVNGYKWFEMIANG